MERGQIWAPSFKFDALRIFVLDVDAITDEDATSNLDTSKLVQERPQRRRTGEESG
jgi:hypothetical protein